MVRKQELTNRVNTKEDPNEQSKYDSVIETSRRMANVDGEFCEIIDAAVREAQYWKEGYLK